MTDKPEIRRFQGDIPKEVVCANVVRIETVIGASAVTHRLQGTGHETRYEISGSVIVRPNRAPTRQFLVVTVGDDLRFEAEDSKLFVSGCVADGEGPAVDASKYFLVPYRPS